MRVFLFLLKFIQIVKTIRRSCLNRNLTNDQVGISRTKEDVLPLKKGKTSSLHAEPYDKNSYNNLVRKP